MILSEKITELRKRCGLSQEEFGAEIGVSRQAVSKWEMAQTTPDLNKIMAMAEFFGVSTDFLLKDEYDLKDLVGGKIARITAQGMGTNHQADGYGMTMNAGGDLDEGRAVNAGMALNNGRESVAEIRRIELSEAQEYLRAKKTAARNFVISNVLFWTSPFLGIYFSFQNESLIPAGVLAELIMLSVLAILLVVTIWRLSKYKRFFQKDAELAYGVRGVVEEAKRKFDRTFLIGVILGVFSSLTFVIPMVILSGFPNAGEFAMVLAAYAMLLIFAFGASCFIYVLTINHGYNKILKIR